MAKILIPTKPNDLHTILTQLALEEKGHNVTPWYTADFPSQQNHSFEILNKDSLWFANGTNFKIEDNAFDTVWYRRPQRPVLSDLVHPDDQKNARKECGIFFETLWEMIAPNATWVNPPKNARSAHSKSLQLKIASELGLKVPKTMISNDPDRIKDFFAKCDSNVIYKPFHSMNWAKENDIRHTYTKEINIKQLPSDFVLSMAPGIFQEKIQKCYELRVTYFGDYSVAVKLQSQEHPKGKIDWRYIPINELLVEKYNLPDAIDKKCKILMQKLGIVFGCFDFIVTPDKEYYFLEVNESGQFLWIEYANPQIKILDIFSEFLVSKPSSFKWTESSNTISMSDFREKPEILLQKSCELHVRPPI